MEEIERSTAFVYRSYLKEELAQMYLPGYARSTALKKFNRWIKKSPEFQEQLRCMGVDLRTRIYTTAQVHKIVSHLGEP